MDFSQLFVGLLVIAGVFLWLRHGRTRTPTKPEDASRYGSHGTARWAMLHELRKYLRLDGPGFLFGKEVLPRFAIRTHAGKLIISWARDPKKLQDRRAITVWRDGLRPHLTFGPDPGCYLTYPPDAPVRNQNITVVGASGTMKTLAIVQPNILQTAMHGGESQIIIDPKGENYRRSAALLRKRGIKVFVFNLEHPERSDTWNPLDGVAGVMGSTDLAVNLVANTVNPNRPRSGDPFWDNAEQAFITALVLYIKGHRPAEEQHMPSVLELGTELSPEGLDKIFLALPRTDPARRFYRSFLRADEKIRGGVVAGLGSRLQLWNSPEIAGLTASSTFRIADFGATPSALFLIIPDSKATYAPLLALFWQQAFEILYRVAEEHGGRLPVPVRCRMDEIANCGFIPDYEKKKSTMRSRGISTEEIWQNLTQMQNRYPSWEELMANADHLLFLGANDLKTAEYLSKLLGQTTIRTHSASSSESHQSSTTGRSDSYTGRPLMTPDEVLGLDNAEAILIPRGAHPSRIWKAPFFQHPLASEIQLEDPTAYQAPPRPPLAITDVVALRTAAQQQAPAAPQEDEPSTGPTDGDDPLDFLDGDDHQPV